MDWRFKASMSADVLIINVAFCDSYKDTPRHFNHINHNPFDFLYFHLHSSKCLSYTLLWFGSECFRKYIPYSFSFVKFSKKLFKNMFVLFQKKIFIPLWQLYSLSNNTQRTLTSVPWRFGINIPAVNVRSCLRAV